MYVETVLLARLLGMLHTRVVMTDVSLEHLAG